MLFWKCRVCAEKDKRLSEQATSYAALVTEKDARITDLRREMELLRKLAFPSKTSSALPVVQLERDKLLNGDSDITEYNSKDGVLIDEDLPDFTDPLIEAHALLTGNF